PARAGTPSPAVTAEGNGRPRTAEALYHRMCARCHDADGSGNTRRARMTTLPDFTAAAWHRSRTDAQLAASLPVGLGDGMPAFADRLSAEQTRDLVTFVRTLGPAPAPQAEAPAGDFEDRSRELQRQFDALQRQLHELRKP